LKDEMAHPGQVYCIYAAKDPGGLAGLLDPLLHSCFMRVLLLRSLLDYFIGSMSISEAKNQDVVY
jgi:hypothetical protein